MAISATTRLVSDACTQVIERRAPTVLVLRIEGYDVGEFGALPMRCLEALLPEEFGVELFVDARATRGVTMHVSNDWAAWLVRRRDRLVGVHMLTASRYVQVTADFVRRFAGLEDRMRVYGDAAEFDAALAALSG